MRLGSTLLALAALAAPLAAQAHPEIHVACDADGRLVATYERETSYPIPPSFLTGIDGYASAIPGLSSLLEGKSGLLVPDPSADIEFVLLGADEGLGVWNDHGSALMKVGESFSLGHPPFDSHPIWQIPKGDVGQRFELKLQLRDRSGRYAPSAEFAPGFTPDESEGRFSCPMACAGGSTFFAPGNCAECGMRLRRLTGRSYAVSITREGAADAPLPANEDVTLRFQLAAPDGTPVTDLEVVHEKLIHLLLVSDDLAWFAHEHPERQPDGSFLLTTRFPHPGGFTLFHDFTPASAGMQVVPVELTVAGEAPAAVPLAPDRSRVRELEGCTVTLQTPAAIRALVNQSLTVRLTREGQPVTDLQPFLGTLGHLIVISADRKRFVHSHPLGAPPAAGAPAGPEVRFSALFPAPGIYKAWVQVQREGAVITAPFVIEVVAP